MHNAQTQTLPLTHAAPSTEKARKIATAVRGLMARHNAQRRPYERMTQATVKMKSAEVARAISEAWQLGYRIHRVENLRPVHCAQLLDAWQRRDLARATVARRWDALRDFCNAVGKPGMLQRLDAVWPKESADAATRIKSRRRTLSDLSEQEYREVLGRLRPTRPIYWVLRLERELGLTREEALMTNLVVAIHRSTGGAMPVSRSGGQQARVVEIATVEQGDLLDGTLRFLKHCGREQLCWSILTAEEGIAKVKNALSYQLRLLKDEQGESHE